MEGDKMQILKLLLLIILYPVYLFLILINSLVKMGGK